MGRRRVRLGVHGLTTLEQAGSAKARIPRAPGPPEVVFLDTSGAVTSGDRRELALDLGPGAVAVATTQAAERAYRAGAGPAAQVTVALTVGRGGWPDGLPRERILFDGARLHRDTTFTLAPGAGCLSVETPVPGRAAMGERGHKLALRDSRTILSGAHPVAAERIHPHPAALARGGAAMLCGNRAFATVIRIGPGDWLARGGRC